MTNSPRETATLTLDALVKEHNVLVSLAAENIQLRTELTNLQIYAQQLEALLAEAVPAEEPDGNQETEPVREEVGQADEGQEVPDVREDLLDPKGTK